MGWYITNGNTYITRPANPFLTTNKNEAYIFQTQKKAQNFLNQTLDKNIPGYDALFVIHQTDNTKSIQNQCHLNSIECDKSQEKLDFEKMLGDFNACIRNMKSLKMHLNNQISHYDIMQSEFYHLFENGKFPAHIRSKLDKKFDECLRNRRRYKMQFAKLTSMEDIMKKYGLNSAVGYCEKGNGTFVPSILTDEFSEYKKFLM